MLRDVAADFYIFRTGGAPRRAGPGPRTVLATDANTADEVEAPRGGAQSAKMVRFGDSCMGLTWLYNVIYIYI